MKITIDKKLHESMLILATVNNGPAKLYLLGKNKENICDKVILLKISGGCHTNPAIPYDNLIKAYIDMHKDGDYVAAGFIRIASGVEIGYARGNNRIYTEWYRLIYSHSYQNKIVAINYVGNKAVAYNFHRKSGIQEIELEIK
jgi:hypothetical protein